MTRLLMLKPVCNVLSLWINYKINRLDKLMYFQYKKVNVFEYFLQILFADKSQSFATIYRKS